MEVTRKQFVGGNWKSNNTLAQTTALVNDVLNKLSFDTSKVEVVVAPVTLHISYVQSALTNKDVQLSVQNSSSTGFGAFTGEITPLQLTELGINWSIIGHSERRTLYNETDEVIAKKAKFGLDNGVKIIYCIGETFAEYENQTTLAVLQRQLEALGAKLELKDWQNVVIAYEPVWAIGTGKVATPEIAQTAHEFIRGWISQNVSNDVATAVRVIYGGSVNGKNSGDLSKQNDIDGFLVGGASLKPEFIDIVKSVSN